MANPNHVNIMVQYFVNPLFNCIETLSPYPNAEEAYTKEVAVP
jgi:hypothetical protein